MGFLRKLFPKPTAEQIQHREAIASRNLQRRLDAVKGVLEPVLREEGHSLGNRLLFGLYEKKAPPGVLELGYWARPVYQLVRHLPEAKMGEADGALVEIRNKRKNVVGMIHIGARAYSNFLQIITRPGEEKGLGRKLQTALIKARGMSNFRARAKQRTYPYISVSSNNNLMPVRKWLAQTPIQHGEG